MIKALHDVDEATAILRQVLLSQCELQPEYVLNGKTFFGAELGKVVDGAIIPFTPDDTFIVFDVNPDNQDEVSMQELDETITTYAGYTMRLVVYGVRSDVVSQRAFSRIKSQEIRNYLLDNGVFVSDISAIESTDEYINSKMWCRADLTISFKIRYSFSKLSKYDDFEGISDLSILK